MAIGRRRRAPQQELFVATSDIRALGNPFYRALNGLLEEHGAVFGFVLERLMESGLLSGKTLGVDVASAVFRHSGALFRLLPAISAVIAANPDARRTKPALPHNPGRLCAAGATHNRLSSGAPFIHGLLVPHEFNNILSRLSATTKCTYDVKAVERLLPDL